MFRARLPLSHGWSLLFCNRLSVCVGFVFCLCSRHHAGGLRLLCPCRIRGFRVPLPGAPGTPIMANPLPRLFRLCVGCDSRYGTASVILWLLALSNFGLSSGLGSCAIMCSPPEPFVFSSGCDACGYFRPHNCCVAAFVSALGCDPALQRIVVASFVVPASCDLFGWVCGRLALERLPILL